MMRIVWTVLALTVLGTGSVRAEDNLPSILREAGVEQRLNEQVPLDLEFRDESGKTVRLGDCCRGKPAILVLAYYRCPMLCTQVLNGLLHGLRGVSLDIGKEFEVVTVSFDARETPKLAAAKKASYIQSYNRPGAAAGWHFWTGDQPVIDRLTQAVGFSYKYDPKKDEFAHASVITILTPQGKVARYFFGTSFSARDLRWSLVEASANQIGSPVDHILLFCYTYDESSGRYTPVVMNFVRWGGILTMLVLGTFLAFAWQRDWRKYRIKTVNKDDATAASSIPERG